MKYTKLLYKIFLSLSYLASAVCFFFPYLKLTINTSFGTLDTDIITEYIFGDDFSKYTSFSPVEILKLCLKSSDFIDTQNLLIESFFLFVIPFTLAIVSAILIVLLKNTKIASMVSGGIGLIGTLTNILLRVFLSENKIDLFGKSISFSSIFSIEPAANICLVLFIITVIASFVMFFLFKNNQDSDIQPSLFNQNSANQGNTLFHFYPNKKPKDYNPQPKYNINTANSFGNNTNNIIEDDKPTERVPKHMLPGFNAENKIIEPDSAKDNLQKDQIKNGTIECINGMYKGICFPVSINEEIVIGRDASQSNIIIDKKYVYVSKKHCGIRYEDSGRYRVKVYSSNGIFIDENERVSQGAEIYVSSGSVISIGNKENSFKLK